MIAVLVLVLVACEKEEAPNNGKNEPADYEPRVKINQETYSANAFTTDEDGDNLGETVHLYIKPMLNLMPTIEGDSYEVTRVTIRNISLEHSLPRGEVKIIHPKHWGRDESCSSYYYTDCEDLPDIDDVGDDGDSFTYSISTSENFFPEFYDEVSSDIGIIDFHIVVHNVGTFDHAAIMERDGVVDGNKSLQYAGLKAEELEMRVSFDLEIEYSDGVVIERSFSGQLPGEQFLNANSVNNMVTVTEGVTF